MGKGEFASRELDVSRAAISNGPWGYRLQQTGIRWNAGIVHRRAHGVLEVKDANVGLKWDPAVVQRPLPIGDWALCSGRACHLLGKNHEPLCVAQGGTVQYGPVDHSSKSTLSNWGVRASLRIKLEHNLVVHYVNQILDLPGCA